MVFHFPDPTAKPSPLVKLDGVRAGYTPAAPILDDLHLSIYSEDRIALLGANGNGKTTLARIFAGELTPQGGALVPAQKLKVGYFAQDHLERLDPAVTAYVQLARAMPESGADKVRGWLGRFGFTQARADVQVAHLSGPLATRFL